MFARSVFLMNRVAPIGVAPVATFPVTHCAHDREQERSSHKPVHRAKQSRHRGLQVRHRDQARLDDDGDRHQADHSNQMGAILRLHG
jgi:hypothetical protein